MMSLPCPIMGGSVAGNGNHGLFVPGPWRARTSLSEYRQGGDPAPRQTIVRMDKIEIGIPNINGKLTVIAVQLLKKASPQGARRGCAASPTYLCSKTLLEAIEASGMNGRDYYHRNTPWPSFR